MKSRGIVGKRIIRIEQVRGAANVPGGMNILAIILEDGTELRPQVREGEDHYEVDFDVVQPERRAV